MARTSFNIGYTQGATGVGQITFTAGSDTRTVDATGRLDKVGDQVVSALIAAALPATDFHAALDVTIECTRTSSRTMRVLVSFAEVGYGISLERVLEDVPLNFGP